MCVRLVHIVSLVVIISRATSWIANDNQCAALRKCTIYRPIFRYKGKSILCHIVYYDTKNVIYCSKSHFYRLIYILTVSLFVVLLVPLRNCSITVEGGIAKLLSIVHPSGYNVKKPLSFSYRLGYFKTNYTVKF